MGFWAGRRSVESTLDSNNLVGWRVKPIDRSFQPIDSPAKPVTTRLPMLTGLTLLFDGPCGGVSNSSPTVSPPLVRWGRIVILRSGVVRVGSENTGFGPSSTSRLVLPWRAAAVNLARSIDRQGNASS